MKRQQRKRKCPNCGAWFEPDVRNVRHQRYCSEAACRQASKAASQRRWLAKPENRDYFRGAEQVARVQCWRAQHPGYGRRASTATAAALQDDCPAQAFSLHLENDCHGHGPRQIRTCPSLTLMVGAVSLTYFRNRVDTLHSRVTGATVSSMGHPGISC
ncbi:hypothetical protein ACAX43_26515 [Paraburkholderia sp. IW21]|uniref:hypothetical protein n=1 Tax=Paraburkholderia sp. IW21 TaxID=3242488 RepID=UPI0035218CE4